jgi:hypothetical protein
MFLSEVPAALLRRWYIVALGLGLTDACAVFVADTVQPAYTVTAQTLLLPPANSVPAGGNPYLSLGGLNAVGDILSEAIHDDSNMAALGFTGSEDFEFFRDENSAAPMMIISVTAPTAETARAEADAILGRVPATLKDLQTKSGVPSDSLITSSVVVNPGAATASTRAQLRGVLATSALGLALTVLLVAAADRLLRARKLRRGGHRHTSAKQDDESPTSSRPDASETASHPRSEPRPDTRFETRPESRHVDHGQVRASSASSVPQASRSRDEHPAPGSVGDPLADLDAELASDAPSS